MISQEKLVERIFLIIGDIRINKATREALFKDSSRREILDLRERLIEIANDLKIIYWIREDNIKDGLLPLTDDGRDEALVKEADSIFKEMTELNSDIVWTKKEHYGIQPEYTAAV